MKYIKQFESEVSSGNASGKAGVGSIPFGRGYMQSGGNNGASGIVFTAVGEPSYTTYKSMKHSKKELKEKRRRLKMFKKFRNEGLISEKIIDQGSWNYGDETNDENIGKYVIMTEFEKDAFASTRENRKELNEFVENNSGKIVASKKSGVGITYMIRYDNIPEHLKKYFVMFDFAKDTEYKYMRAIKRHNTIEFIGTKNECDTKISAKKYNL